MINYKNAQIYFASGSHHKAAVWSGFNQKTREGAIAAARRVLARGLGRALNDDEPEYKEGDRIREEYAVYEQALWMMENGQVANATGSDQVPVLTGKVDAADPSTRNPYAAFAPEALRWFAGAGASIIRG